MFMSVMRCCVMFKKGKKWRHFFAVRSSNQYSGTAQNIEKSIWVKELNRSEERETLNLPGLLRLCSA